MEDIEISTLHKSMENSKNQLGNVFFFEKLTRNQVNSYGIKKQYTK